MNNWYVSLRDREGIYPISGMEDIGDQGNIIQVEGLGEFLPSECSKIYFSKEEAQRAAKELGISLHKAQKTSNANLFKLASKTKSKKLLILAAQKETRDFSDIKGNGIVSDELLDAHFGLYEGYVDSLNKIADELETADREKNGYAYGEFSELKRRLAVPYNGAVLHELYFEEFDKKDRKSKPTGQLEKLINERWSSLDKYLEDVKATALATGNGWVVTVYDPIWERLENFMVTEHHIGYPVNCIPIMVLDIWEHAFAFDYKTARDDYVQKFLENMNYRILEERLSYSPISESTDQE